MLFDIHCHILPAIDDGSKSMEETEKMLRMARKERIGTILATPHYNCEREPGFYKRCHNVYEKVCKMIREKNLGIQLYLGNEIFYSSGVLEALKRGEALTLNHTKYVLVEFAPYVELLTIKRQCRNFRWQVIFRYWLILSDMSA